jgi:hypothetical protein
MQTAPPVDKTAHIYSKMGLYNEIGMHMDVSARKGDFLHPLGMNTNRCPTTRHAIVYNLKCFRKMLTY